MSERKNSVIGILAHVDAGKTTLAEAMLFHAGKLKKPGRVDHRDAFLDTHILERQRGITIFSKQARFSLPRRDVFLLDTPGTRISPPRRSAACGCWTARCWSSAAPTASRRTRKPFGICSGVTRSRYLCS